MKPKTSENKNQAQEGLQKIKQQDAKLKYFIQMLDIKRDTNMTRIYSAMQSFRTS